MGSMCFFICHFRKHMLQRTVYICHIQKDLLFYGYFISLVVILKKGNSIFG